MPPMNKRPAPTKTPKPTKAPVRTPGKPDVPKLVKLAVSETLPEATVLGSGYAVLLAGLAEAMGMHVPHVVEFPDRLIEAGLPTALDRWIVILAQKLNRNAIDATLWRCNRRLSEQVPEHSWDEAKRIASGAPTPKQAEAVAFNRPPQKPVAPPSESFDLFG